MFGRDIKKFLRGDQTHQETVGSIVGFIILSTYPFIALGVLLKFKNRLEDGEILKRIECMYEGISYETKGFLGISYHSIYMIRRILFVAIPVFLNFVPWF